MRAPLSLGEIRRLDCDAAYQRAVELGHVKTRREYDDRLHVERLRAALRHRWRGAPRDA